MQPTISTDTTRGLTRLWTLPEPSAGSADAPSGLVPRILAARGLIDPAEVQGFLDPVLRNLHDPSLIPDMDRAAARILAALDARESIVIYGDYDVDGITATAILYHTLKAIAPEADVRSYVPHRLDEGYGLSAEALLKMAADGVGLVVSVDCGITAVGPAAAAAKAGLDLIITDHHNPPRTLEDLPPAFAVVHPRRPDSEYPFGELCGAGVAYKLAWRLATMRCGSDRVSAELRLLLMELLAFAALGSVADMVPLVGENRVLASHGLRCIRERDAGRLRHLAPPGSSVGRSPLAGLRRLADASGLGGESISADHVGFLLGPRLNACGRMGHAREAVELLTTATGAEADAIAKNLSAANEQRKLIERRITEEAAALAEARGMTSPDRRAIVLAEPPGANWHGGVLGICASRLVDRFCRPAILMRIKEDDGRPAYSGSGRSIGGFNLHAALARCSGLLMGFGGHDMAAGVRVAADRLDEFIEAFTAEANAGIAPDRLLPSVRIDCEASLADLTPEAVAAVDRMAPFGMGNPRPKILLTNLQLTARAEPFGRGNKHLSLQVRQGDRMTRMVGWSWGERWEQLPAGITIDAVVQPKISDYSKRVEPELLDLRVV